MVQNIIDNFNTFIGQVCRFGGELVTIVKCERGNSNQIAAGRGSADKRGCRVDK
jgi:hypothetical protein